MKTKNQFYLFRKRCRNAVQLLAFIALTIFVQPTFASVSIQNTRIKIVEKNISLADLIWKIDSQTEYEFVYTSEELEGHHFSSINKEGELNDVLDEIFKGKNLSYSQKEGVYVIKKLAPKPVKKEKTKKKKIQGKVTDKDGVPLPGVSVLIKGSTIGVATDVDGIYSLELEDQHAVLVFSFVGMTSREIAFTGQSILNVSLTCDSEQMDEVVVTGYQTICKERATGSFEIIKNEDMDKVISIDLTDKLQGITPGLRLDANGQFLLRGQNTFSAETQPLIVLNGYPWNGELSDLNVDDIKQVTVLKDAASTAIYGIRGANGVIVITTKNEDTKGRLRVTYSASLQYGQKPRAADMDRMSSADYVDLEWDKYDLAGMYSSPTYNFRSQIGEIWTRYQAENDPATKEAIKSEINQYRDYDNGKEIEKYFYQNPLIHKHSLSFNYGTDKNKFYASVGYSKNLSSIKGNENDAMIFNLTDDFTLSDKFALHLNLLGNLNNSEMDGMSDLLTLGTYGTSIRPYVRFKDENGEYVDELKSSFNIHTRQLHEEMGAYSEFYNRVQEQELKDVTNEVNGMTFNVSLDFKPTDWLKITPSYSYQMTTFVNEIFNDKESWYVRNTVNKYTAPDGKQRIPYGNILKWSNGNTKSSTARLLASINKTINEFSFTLNAGIERNKMEVSSNLNNYRFNYDEQRLTEETVDFRDLTQRQYNKYGYSAAFSTYSTASVSKSEERYQSSFLIGGISYKGKYDLSGSWRLDETNLFGQSDEYRQQPAWSLGTKWNISEEEFFNVSWIDKLSIKASYGLAGNVEKSTSPFLIGSYGISGFTALPYLSVDNPENPELGWEKTYTTNLTLGYSLFKNRLSGNVEFYNRKTEDVLATVSLDPTTGFGGAFSRVKKNNGEIINKGIDFSLNAKIINNKGFTYDLGFVLSYNYNKALVVESENLSTYSLTQSSARQGQPVDYIYGFRNAGLDSEGEPLIYNPGGEIVSYKEISDLGEEGGVFFGRKSPPVFGSFSHMFTYKKFSLDAFFLYDLGHYAKQYSSTFLSRDPGSRSIHEIYSQRWKQAGDEETTWIPKLSTAWDPDRDYAVFSSDKSIQRADLIQLKSINIGYDFTDLLHSKSVKMAKLRIGAENLWEWSALSSGRAYDRIGMFPRYKKYNMSLTLQF